MTKIFANLLYSLLYLLSLLPLKFLYKISDLISFFLFKVFRYRMNVVYTNLARSFPNMKYSELNKEVKKYYQYLGDMTVESIWCLSASPKQLKSLIKIQNPELMYKQLSRDSNMLFVVGHSGNWELLLIAISKASDYMRAKSSASKEINPFYTVYKSAKGKVVDLMVKKMRARRYNDLNLKGELICSKKVIRKIFKSRNTIGSYGFIADQSPSSSDKFVINFLNQPTYMIAGPEYLARKLNMGVTYMYMNRIKRGDYEVKYTEITENAANEEDGFVISQFSKLLEKDIISNPYNWLWSHKRWKREIIGEDLNRIKIN